MKRTFRNRTSALPLLLSILGVVLLFVGVFLLRPKLTDALWFVLAPLQAHNPLAQVTSLVVSKAQLQNENAALRATLASTSALVFDRNLLFQENLELKMRLGRVGTGRTILAGVLLRPPAVPYDTLTIDAGSGQGVKVGQYVSAGGTTRIGQVDSVSADTARVVLLSAPGTSHQALLLETAAHTALPVTVEGQGGASMVAEVPAHTAVVKGDAIAFPGVADGVAGVVTHVDSAATESFERIYIQLPVNPLELRYVEVVVE